MNVILPSTDTVSIAKINHSSPLSQLCTEMQKKKKHQKEHPEIFEEDFRYNFFSPDGNLQFNFHCRF